MHKFLLIFIIFYKNYSCLSKVRKIGAVFLRFMMMHEQIENISLRIRWKWDPKFYLPASTMASAPPADNFRTSWSIEQRTFCVQRHQHHNSFKLLETAGKQQSHQSKDRLRMGPTQSWSQPPRFFLVGLPEGSGLQNKPSNYWWAEKKHPNRDGSHWRSNLPRCDVQLHPPHGDVSASGRRTFGATAVGRATLQLEFWYFM